MSFLNAILALGALAFTVPLLIHLLYRTRFTTVEWGAMHLLSDAVDANRRRIEVSNLLLLLVRCLIPVLLALCLARPVVTHWKSLPGDVPQSLVIVLDDSRSMSAREPNGVVRFDKARQGLKQLLQQLSRHDEIILLQSSRLDQTPGKMGVQSAVEKIDTVTATAGVVDLGKMITAAIDAASEASHRFRHILIVSDFQSNIVDDAATKAISTLAASNKEQPLPPMFSFLTVSSRSETLQNVSVDSIEIEAPAVVADRKTQMSARIRNASDSAIRNLRISWSIDDEVVRVQSVDIDPRSSTIARRTVKLNQPGLAKVSVAVEHDDALIADNRRELMVSVLDEVRVLLIDGHPSSQPLRGETDFLSIALSPFSFARGDVSDPIRTDVTSVTRLGRLRLERDSSIADYDVVMLANVERIDSETRKRIAQYVLDGGSLVVFDGDRVDVKEFNQPWGEADRVLHFPARLGEIVGDSAARDREPFRIADVNRQYAPWQSLSEQNPQPLADVDVFAYRKLNVTKPKDDDSELNTNEQSQQQRSASHSILMKMAGGDPLVVYAQRGKGRVVQFGIPSDSDWTTVPLRPAFVPLMQQLVMGLAGSGAAARSGSGDVPAEESVLRDANPQRLTSIADSLGGSVYQDVQSLQSDEQVRRFGREVWRWLLILLLLAMVAEVVLQQYRTGPQYAAAAESRKESPKALEAT